MDELIKITPDKDKARSVLKMVDTTLEMVKSIDINRFPSNVTKEYYEIIRELLSAILLLDGYKTYGEYAHKKQISYLEENYKDFKKHEIYLIDELRVIRNRIAYDGFFIESDYIQRMIKSINSLIIKLKVLVANKIDPS